MHHRRRRRRRCRLRRCCRRCRHRRRHCFSVESKNLTAFIGHANKAFLICFLFLVEDIIKDMLTPRDLVSK